MKLTRFVLVSFVALFVSAPAAATSHWGIYGPWFASIAGNLARRVSPSQRIVVVGTRVFTPHAEGTITMWCGGFQGIRAFSILFAVALLLNWRNSAKLRILILYIGGVVLLWCRNLAGVTLAIVRGGETHYGTSALAVLVLSIILAIATMRSRSAPMGPEPSPRPR